MAGTEAESSSDLWPIFDTLDRLLSRGYTIGPPEGDATTWHLFSPCGQAVTEGESFRKLCVNIIFCDL